MFLAASRPGLVGWTESLHGWMDIKSVQRKFTKRLPSFQNLSCTTRREKLGLTTLELRRVHFDLVVCYKIVFNPIKVQFDDFSPLFLLQKLVATPIDCL